MLSILPWLLSGRDRPEYVLDPVLFSHDGWEWEVGAAGCLLTLLVVARFTFNALLRRPTQRLAERRGTDAHHRDGSRLLEEVWVTAGNLVMLGMSMHVLLRKNGGCWFLNTSTCLVGWPNLPTEPEVRRYYQLELAWYLHMLLKPVLRYGLPDGRDMLIHHAASLTLIVISYVTNLTRLGTVVLGTFAMSNPLLHLAKICNQLSLGPLKIGGFMIFALIFFLSRILLVPWAVLKVTWLDCRHEVPYAVEDFWAIHLVYSLLLTLLYAMQLLWMRGILRVLRSALQHGSDAASHMSARIDPAKRYKVGADPGAPPVRGAAAAQHGGSNGAANGALPRTPSPPDPPTLPKGSNGGEGATGRKNR